MAVHADLIKSLLRPLGIYALRDSIVASHIEAEGMELDALAVVLAQNEKEALIMSSDGYALTQYEKILPYAFHGYSIEDRRAAIAALLRIDGSSFTEKALNDTISGCGIKAVVEETELHYTVLVSFPDAPGVPSELEALQQRVIDILPCHLQVVFVMKNLRWRDIENSKVTWNDMALFMPDWEV